MRKWKHIAVAAATVVAVTVSWRWGLALRLWPVSVLSGGNESEVEIICRVMPHHIVNPESLHPAAGQDLTLAWLLQETKIRMLMIWLFWSVILTAIIMFRKRAASQTLEASIASAP